MFDRFFFMVALCFSTVLMFCLSCSGDDDMDVNTDYIKFYEDGPALSRSFDLDAQVNKKVKQFAFVTDIYTENLTFTTLFEPLSEVPLQISVGKTFGFINISKGRLEVYKAGEEFRDAELKEVLPLPISIQKNFLYAVGFHRAADSLTFFLRKMTQENITIASYTKTYHVSEDPYLTLMWGKPFFTVYEGQVRIHNSWVTTDYSKPTLSIFGDSFVEGAFLLFNNLKLDSRWCTQLASAIGWQKCFVDGRGGQKMSAEFIKRFNVENSWYKTKYVLLALGTNNCLDVDEYKKYMQQAIDIVRSNRQIPILMTVPPRSGFDYWTITKPINDWVKNSGLKFIDIHKAVTQKDSPQKWIVGYVMYDGLHPAPQGYSAMYKQIQLDIPELFN